MQKIFQQFLVSLIDVTTHAPRVHAVNMVMYRKLLTLQLVVRCVMLDGILIWKPFQRSCKARKLSARSVLSDDGLPIPAKKKTLPVSFANPDDSRTARLQAASTAARPVQRVVSMTQWGLLLLKIALHVQLDSFKQHEDKLIACHAHPEKHRIKQARTIASFVLSANIH
jgi:hypothetical protein